MDQIRRAGGCERSRRRHGCEARVRRRPTGPMIDCPGGDSCHMRGRQRRREVTSKRNGQFRRLEGEVFQRTPSPHLQGSGARPIRLRVGRGHDRLRLREREPLASLRRPVSQLAGIRHGRVRHRDELMALAAEHGNLDDDRAFDGATVNAQDDHPVRRPSARAVQLGFGEIPLGEQRVGIARQQPEFTKAERFGIVPGRGLDRLLNRRLRRFKSRRRWLGRSLRVGGRIGIAFQEDRRNGEVKWTLGRGRRHGRRRHVRRFAFCRGKVSGGWLLRGFFLGVHGGPEAAGWGNPCAHSVGRPSPDRQRKTPAGSAGLSAGPHSSPRAPRRAGPGERGPARRNWFPQTGQAGCGAWPEPRAQCRTAG